VIRHALILAAGNGDRFLEPSHESKLLHPVLGSPLVVRAMLTACDAGVAAFEFVVGFQADAIRRVIERHRPPGVSVHFTNNPEWRLENGVSVLAARDRLGNRPFALLMGDHLFEAPALARLLRTPLALDECALAVDRRPASPEVVAEATRVRTEGSRIVAIGKQLEPFDALDTGMFVCSPSLFDALTQARSAGDTTLSAGIRLLAGRGLVRAIDTGAADWFDIDTRADLEAAESRLAAEAETEPA
jgi:choline kinase